MDGTYKLLRGYYISCSGMDATEKYELHKRVEKLGGTISGSLTTIVTHLVMKEGQTTNKYVVAAMAGIPVVTLDFIRDCEVEASKRGSSSAKRKLQISDADDFDVFSNDGDDRRRECVDGITRCNRIPPFSGCRICTTGFESEIRDEIKRLVTSTVTSIDPENPFHEPIYSGSSDSDQKSILSGGGTYHGELTPECTHLIAQTPSGQKYMFAKRWKVHTVSIEWFIRCIQTGFRQKESDYMMGAPINPAQPVSRAASAVIVDVPESSLNAPPPSIDYRRQRSLSKHGSASSATLDAIPLTRTSDANNSDTGSFLGNQFLTSRNLTRNNTANESVSSEAPDLQLELIESVYIDTDDEVVCINRNPPNAGNDAVAAPSRSRIVEKRMFSSPVVATTEAEMLPDSTDSLFDGCHIALSEMSLSVARRKEWHTKIAAAGGVWIADGALKRQISRLAPNGIHHTGLLRCTHFIVDDSEELCDEDVDILRSLPVYVDRPAVLKCGWLRECWRAKQRVDEAPFCIAWPDSVADEKKKAGDSIDMSSDGCSVEVTSAQTLPPHPRHLASANAEGALGMARTMQRQHAASSFVGRPIETSGVNDLGPDPFTSRSNHVVHRSAPDTIDDVSLPDRDYKQSRVSGIHSTLDSALETARRLDPLANANTDEVTASDSADDKGTSHIFDKCIFVTLGLSESGVVTLQQMVSQYGGQYIEIATLAPTLSDMQPHGSVGSSINMRLYEALINAVGMARNEAASDVYIVVHLAGIEELPLCDAIAAFYPWAHVVTECWVETCIEHGKRYPDYSAFELHPDICSELSQGQHTLFRPLWKNHIEGSEQMLLSITGYAGNERYYIGRLAQELGIPFSETFSRKTTHLICERPFTGPKFERAKKWNTPVVESAWLYDIANATRAVVPVVALPVLVSGQHSASVANPTMKTPASGGIRGKHVKQLAGLHSTASPATRAIRQLAAGTPGRTPIDISLERNLQQALGNNNNATHHRHGAASGFADDVTQMSPTRGSHTSLLGADLLGPASSDPEPTDISHILEGVVIALSSRLYYMRNELAPLALSMGCRFLSSFDINQATHLVHQSPRERETAKEYRSAVQNDILVVSPLWLSACRQAMQRVPETDFPYNFQLRRRLDQLSMVPSKPPQPLAASNGAAPKRTRTPAQGALRQAGPSEVKTIDTTDAHKDSMSGVAQLQKGDTISNASSDIDAAVSSDNPSAIGSLSGIKVMRTQRRYRQAATRVAGSATRDVWTIKEPTAAAAATSTGDNSINADSRQIRRSLSGERSLTSAGESDSSRKSSIATRSLSASAVLPTAHTDAVADTDSLEAELQSVSRQSGMQTPSKWWLSSGQLTSAGYSSANHMHLYSQDFQLSGNKSLDSMPNTSEPNDTQAFLGSVTRMTMTAAPRLAQHSNPEAGWTSMDGAQRDRTTANTKEALQPDQNERSATGPNAAGSPSSPTGIQKTTIVYEDTKALSERELLLAKLTGE
ncbi:protein kinase activating protein dpb11 [Coemansia erecta]|uniref:Protein kinase activating protein dpb11 n=1 Tax=Coemansia erecta TaxID=147472 RepID=A0A9W8CTF1_9FUNG|nr:protein kinase activating protein dpb11 [Coemansia erecta]